MTQSYITGTLHPQQIEVSHAVQHHQCIAPGSVHLQASCAHAHCHDSAQMDISELYYRLVLPGVEKAWPACTTLAHIAEHLTMHRQTAQMANSTLYNRLLKTY